MGSSTATVDFESLEIGLDGPIATITMSRPDVMNRFDAGVMHEFVEALRAVRARSEVRAAVLASTGPVFSAGGDFAFMRTLHDDVGERVKAVDQGRVFLGALFDFPLPIVAAVQGDAVGLGLSVAISCDAVVVSRTASLSDPHVAIGLAAGDGCGIWPHAVGMLRAKRYLLTGDALSAEEAHDIGLVTDLVDSPDEVLPAALALAGRVAALPPLAVQGTKRALNRIQQERAGEVLALSFANEGLSMASDDLLEAIDAFRNKREPTYHGR